MLDFKTKSRPFHTAAIDPSKNAKFLAVNHGPVSFEKETYKGNKRIPTRFTIIRPLTAGWAAAPYKQGQKGVKTSKLSELLGGNNLATKFYAYEKLPNNMEKGPRCEDITFELRATNTLNFWLDEKRLDELKKTLNPELTKIEPFTLCEIQVAPRNREAVTTKNSGCKIVEVQPSPYTLHSCIQDIETFPPTYAEARTAVLNTAQTQVNISNDLVVNEPAFHLHVSHKAYIHDPEDQESTVVTLVNSGTEPVDIPVQTLLHYTNCTKKDQACSLLEMAIANSALQLLVIGNDFWKTATTSSLRGIPIINTEILLQSIIPALVGEQTCFQTQNTTTVDDVTYSIQIHVDPDPVTVANGNPPASPDFVLASPQVELERAYKIRFALSAPDGDEIPRYWAGYFDASPRRSLPAVGFRKRKFIQGEE